MKTNSRLPRRFDSVMKTLRELMQSTSEKTRLAAALRASEILLEHQRGQERVAVAIERAAARKAEAEALDNTVQEPTNTPRETAEEFLHRTRANNGATNIE